jgi:hypothetical protein
MNETKSEYSIPTDVTSAKLTIRNVILLVVFLVPFISSAILGYTRIVDHHKSMQEDILENQHNITSLDIISEDYKEFVIKFGRFKEILSECQRVTCKNEEELYLLRGDLRELKKDVNHLKERMDQ